MERAEEMRVEHAGELLAGHRVERLVAEDAGVVHHRVDPAERGDRGLDDSRAALRGRHRLMRRGRTSTGGLDLGDDLFGVALGVAGAVDVGSEVVDHDGRASRRELECVGASEPVAGSGDDDDPAVERDRRHCHGDHSARLAPLGPRFPTPSTR